MRTGYTFKLVIVVLLSFFHQMIVSVWGSKDSVQAVFDVIPNTGTKSFKKEWGDLHCEFTYSCVGETNEYILDIIQNNDDSYFCIVERPIRTSNLNFHYFELKIGGGKLQDGVLFEQDHYTKCNKDEYIVDHEKNTVSNSNNFKGRVHKVVAVFNKKRRNRAVEIWTITKINTSCADPEWGPGEPPPPEIVTKMWLYIYIGLSGA